MRRVCLIVLDSLGVGGAPDAAGFGDEGADTLGHIARSCWMGLANRNRSGPLRLPALERLGLGLAAALSTGHVPAGFGVAPVGCVAKYGCATQISHGKDTPSGHFELTGAPVLKDWGYFESETNSMPPELLARLIQRAGTPGLLGNCKASGTEILTRLGGEHVRSGKPIVYTSADSVLQIAAHELYFGLERLYSVCQIARQLVDEYRIARVIARPFVGEAGSGFVRTGNRRDYAMPAPSPTLLDKVSESGGKVICVGKVSDIFAGRGVTESVRAYGHDQIMNATLDALGRAGEQTLIMANFVDFDSVYGHRRDVAGYAGALEAFDVRLPELLECLEPGDVCIITADHGCDPTWLGTDHTRERVPILVCGPGIRPGCIGVRASQSDVGASVAHFLAIGSIGPGCSFLTERDLPQSVT